MRGWDISLDWPLKLTLSSWTESQVTPGLILLRGWYLGPWHILLCCWPLGLNLMSTPDMMGWLKVPAHTHTQPTCGLTSPLWFLSNEVLDLPCALRRTRWFNTRLIFTYSGTVMKPIFKNTRSSYLRRAPYRRAMVAICKLSSCIISHVIFKILLEAGKKKKVLFSSLCKWGHSDSAGLRTQALDFQCSSGCIGSPLVS